MKFSFLLLPLFAISAIAAGSSAEAQKASKQKDSAAAAISTLTTGTQLVVVDVVVEDHEGHPVHGLQRSDFKLDEGKNQQTVQSFEEHNSNAASNKLPPVPKLPPGIFTDYTALPPDTPLTVLLLDALNTPTRDQAFIRTQLQKYVRDANPQSRIAIFGLNGGLNLLQGFTSDPALLKIAVDKKLKTHSSGVMANPAGSGEHPDSAAESAADFADAMTSIGSDAAPDLAMAATGLQRFEAVSSAAQKNVRARLTLDAFNQLAHYLGAFPGRKNLIWFSESFPISVLPNPDLGQPFDVVKDSSQEFRETTNLLTRARVAVYPVDAREVLDAPMFRTGIGSLNASREPILSARDDIDNFADNEAQQHSTMDQMAEDTGGHAYFDGTPLGTIVTKTLESGASYYTLTYSPSDHNWNGDYRKIHVALEGEPSARKLKLAYRHGYYADDIKHPHAQKSSPLVSPETAVKPASGSAAYSNSAMQRGAPAPSEVLFTVRVLPASTATEEKVSPHNSPNPNGTFKGPYRNFDVDIATLPSNFDLTPQEDGLRHGSVEYVTYVYDTDGRLLNTDSSIIALGLSADNYEKLSTAGLGFRQQISVPAKGESFLRIAVHDVPSGRFGVVEVPVSVVHNLPPAPATPGAQ